MAGFQQLRVTGEVDFTGAQQKGLGDGITRRGTTWYVLGGESGTVGSDTSDGKSWSYPLKTITQAVANAADYDTIVCGANTDQRAYLEGATVNITKDGLRLYGAMTSGHTWGLPSIHTHGTETLVKVNAHAVTIGFIGFHDQGAGCALEVGTTADTWRTHIHDCYFGGNSAALWAAVLGNTTGSGVGTGATIDAPCTVLERCFFTDFVTGAIFFNCGYGSVVRDNVIQVYTAVDGIRYYTDSTSRQFAFILNNKFTTADATNANGIVVTNTPTAGYLMIDGNHFINFADNDKCISKRTGYTGLNYLGLTAIAIT